MRAIVNVNREWAIGRGNELLVYIPEDMKFFRQTTAGKTVVMGRKTLESFPGKRPLKGRTNIVLTKDPARIPSESLEAAAADPGTRLVTASSPAELAGLLEELGTGEEDCYVIGGASVYRQLLPLCSTCLVTVNDYTTAPGQEADSWFPDLDSDPDWECTERGEEQEYNGVHFQFCTYRRRKDS